MKKLNPEETLFFASQLFNLFGYDGKKLARKYLKSKTRKFFNIIIAAKPFPNLWFPQRREAKFISDLFGDFITFNHDSGSKYVHALKEIIIPNVSSFLSSNGFEEFYALADWRARNGKENYVLRLKNDELHLVVGKFVTEAYFFDKGFAWLFVITHENFSFFASNADLISKFKNTFKEYKKFDTERGMIEL